MIVIKEGDYISLRWLTGNVYLGEILKQLSQYNWIILKNLCIGLMK